MSFSVEDEQRAATRFLEVMKGITRIERSILDLHHRFEQLENLMVTGNATLASIKDDSDRILAMQQKQSQLIAGLVSSQVDEMSRLKTIIDALRSGTTPADQTTMNTIASQLEASLTGFQAVADGMTQATATEVASEAAVVISPSTLSLAPGGTQSFTANVPVKWSSQSTAGSIDQQGNYVAPNDGSTSDTVGAVSLQDAGLTATVSVTIVAAPAIAGATGSGTATGA